MDSLRAPGRVRRTVSSLGVPRLRMARHIHRPTHRHLRPLAPGSAHVTAKRMVEREGSKPSDSIRTPRTFKPLRQTSTCPQTSHNSAPWSGQVATEWPDAAVAAASHKPPRKLLPLHGNARMPFSAQDRIRCVRSSFLHCVFSFGSQLLESVTFGCPQATLQCQLFGRAQKNMIPNK